VRVTLVLSIFFAGNAFAAGDERSVDPSRFDFANTPVFHSMLDRAEKLPSSATGHVVENHMEAQGATLSASGKARIAMWTSSPNLPKAEVLAAAPPRAPSNADLVIEEIVPQAEPSETITAKTVRFASIDGKTHRRQVSRLKRTAPNPSGVDDQAEPSWFQVMFDTLFQGD
jgi:hypothetical protein